MIRCLWCHQWNRENAAMCSSCGRSLHSKPRFTAEAGFAAQAPAMAVPRARGGFLRTAAAVGGLAVLGLVLLLLFSILRPGAPVPLAGRVEEPAPTQPAAAPIREPTTTAGVPTRTPAVATPTTVATASPPPSPTTRLPDATVNTDRLNLRDGPSLQHRPIGVYPYGTPLEVLGKDAADPVWLKARTPDGKVGWMFVGYLKVNIVLDPEPVLGATPTRTPVPPGADPIERVMRATVRLSFFGEDGPIPLGSGTVVTEDGLILTANHVVRDITEDGTGELYNPYGEFLVALTVDPNEPPEDQYLACVVAEDSEYDLAVLRINAIPDGNPVAPSSLRLMTVPLGNSERVAPRDEVTVVGYPNTGLTTVTAPSGTISGFYAGYIKTDTDFSFGSSGGAAVNAQGELIGVPIAVIVDGAGKTGYLAPVNAARALIQQAGQSCP